jgi:CRISPR/Cas system-associated endonuclease Cas1
MGRTLYLNENRGLRVRRDGPSVWMHWMDRSGRRVPVRLVSRVVIIGNVKIEAGAVTLFTENDIPVVFMNYAGEEVAVAIPYNHRLAKHYEEQKVYLATPESGERFMKWVETKRMVIQVDVLRRLVKKMAYGLRFGLGEGDYQELLSRLKTVGEEQWLGVTGAVTNLLRAQVIEHLLRADLDPHLGVMHRRHNFGLALDICHILSAEVDMQGIQFFRSGNEKVFLERKGGGWTLTGSGMRNLIQRFENRRAALDATVEIVIDELFELMRELRT